MALYTSRRIIIKNGRKEHLPRELTIGELAYCIDTNELYVGTEDGPKLLNNYGNVLSELSLRMPESNAVTQNISITAPIYSHIQAQNQLEKDREKFKQAMLKAIEDMPFEDKQQYLQSIYKQITEEE